MADNKLATKDGLSVTEYTSLVRESVSRRVLTGLLSYSIDYRDRNLINNPYKNRYYNDNIYPAMNGFDGIGEIADVYYNEKNIITFLDDDGGLKGYTENNSFRPSYSDYKSKYSLLNDIDYYSVSTELGKNSYNLSESISDAVRNIGKEILGLSGINTYYPRKNANTAGVYALYQEDGEPVIDSQEHISLNDIVTVLEDTDEFVETDLLGKTNRLFRQNKIKSLINRFCSNAQGDASSGTDGLFKGATSIFGYSRGRNLLKKNIDVINSYTNPYCRVWTSHYQYSKMTDLIRPFVNSDGSFTSLYDLQRQYGMLRPYYSNARLRDYSTLERGGIPRITPDKELIFGEGYATENHSNIKNYMLSIENLAWKDAGDYYTSYLSKEQRGPHGGRIMWFPPYNISFNESTNASWNNVNFLGRIEPVYNYVGGGERSGTLSFSILVDHPSVINLFKEKKLNILDSEVEDALLRYFAGCDDLSSYLPHNLTQEWVHYSAWTENTVKTVTEQEYVGGTVEETGSSDPVEKSEEKKVRCVFIVFYPNNSSGYQDVNQKSNAEDKKTGSTQYFETKWGKVRKYESKEAGKGTFGYERGIHYYTKNTETGKYTEVETKQIKCISYDYSESGSAATVDSSNCLVDTEGNVWKQSDKTKIDREDFALNSSSFANSLEEYFKDSSKTSTTLNKVVSMLGLNSDDYKNSYVFGLENMSGNGFSLNAIFEKVKGEDVKITDDEILREVNVSVRNGSASSHGSDVKEDDGTSMNVALGRRRAETLLYYLLHKGIIDKEEDVTKALASMDSKTIPVDEIAGDDVSDLSAKIGRNAIVTIDFTLRTKQDGEDAPIESNSYTTGYTVYKETQEVETKEKIKVYDWSEQIDDVAFDNEFLYFDRIKNERDSIVYKNIKDKIKFFDPAFHSITPEGFNARLTFLQQCMRPGPTNSASDTNSLSTYGAGNLAFGRPPVCILRIGDFFFSKVLIKNINIQYDSGGLMPLDLNPEGIGVQPLIAKVNMGITIIGGQDITGPIAQLQNAVSSNFYANASIYDKSAATNDIGVYKKGGIRVNN